MIFYIDSLLCITQLDAFFIIHRIRDQNRHLYEVA